MPATLFGICKTWKDGFGFIVPSDKAVNGGKDVFVHWSSIQMDGRKALVEGQQVEFKLGKDTQGRPCAVDVVPGDVTA